jgi:hypothetical protein
MFDVSGVYSVGEAGIISQEPRNGQENWCEPPCILASSDLGTILPWLHQ